jgi:hypothetical protein
MWFSRKPHPPIMVMVFFIGTIDKGSNKVVSKVINVLLIHLSSGMGAFYIKFYNII